MTKLIEDAKNIDTTKAIQDCVRNGKKHSLWMAAVEAVLLSWQEGDSTATGMLENRR